MRRRTMVLALVLLAQLLLVGVAVAGQLSARVTGDEIRLRVGPVDPIDPFRGAYVDLRYPDLEPELEPRDEWRGVPEGVGGDRGRLYVALRRDGDVWVADRWTRERPDGGTYLACDDGGWQQRCGIESLFLPQADAERIQEEIDQSGLWADEDGTVDAAGWVAVVKVDRWGNAAVVDVAKE